MSGSERDNHVCENEGTHEAFTHNIAELNDQLRCHARGGQLAITSGVLDLGPTLVPLVLEAVRSFSDFTTDNDPYGEHDFGAVTVMGHQVLWKIDYYDRNMQFGSPDPADPEVTTRLLTIMLAQEY